eukprot:scaffold149896_cov12-Tisochrysis_lutea.AAC.1
MITLPFCFRQKRTKLANVTNTQEDSPQPHPSWIQEETHAGTETVELRQMTSSTEVNTETRTSSVGLVPPPLDCDRPDTPISAEHQSWLHFRMESNPVGIKGQ